MATYRSTLLVPSLALLLCTPLLGQTPLFLSVGPDAVSGDPAPGIAAIYPVTVAFDDLAQAPAQLAVELPDFGIVTADLRVFEAKEGFDAPGVPSPGTTIDDLRYVWRGQGQGHDVIVAVAYGWPSATLIGPGGDFTFQQTIDLVTQTLVSFNLVELAPLPFPEEVPMEPPPAALAQPARAPLPVKERESLEPDESIRYKDELLGSCLSETQVITVLAAFTEQARIDVGGNVIDYKDAAAMMSLIDLGIGETNQTLENSGINVRLEVVVTARLPDFVPSGIADDDRDRLQQNADIKQWRTQFKVDTVSVILENEVMSSGFCGFAYTQRPGCGDSGPIAGCNPGLAFHDFALHWAAVNCARDRKTIPHEVGHNFGMEHNVESLPVWFGRDRALFSDGFGYVYDAGVINFRTIMALGSSNRILYYSNPYANYSGIPTGVLNDRYAARVAQVTSPDMSGFEDSLSSIISCDDFEAADTESWR